MEKIYTALIVAPIVLVIFLIWLSRYFKRLSKKEKYFFEPKENRANEIDKSQELDYLTLSRKGSCYFHQYRDYGGNDVFNTDEIRRFKLKRDDKGFVILDIKGDPTIVELEEGESTAWPDEEEKWQIVPDPGFKLFKWRQLTAFQRICLRVLGIYYFGGLIAKEYSLRYRQIDIAVVVEKEEKVGDKMVKVVTIKKIEPSLSKHIYTGYETYAYELLNSEDSTGNPMNAVITCKRRCVNPWTSWFGNEDWTITTKEEILSIAAEIIKTRPFLLLDRLAGEKRLSSEEREAMAKARSDAGAILCGTLLERMNATRDGFHYEIFTLRNIDPARKELVAANERLLISEIDKLAAENAADGEAYKKKKLGDIDIDLLRRTIEEIGKDTKSAAIRSIDNFKNVKMLSVGPNNNAIAYGLTMDDDKNLIPASDEDETTNSKKKGDKE